MKLTLGLLLACLCALAIANPVGKEEKVADKTFLKQQKDILLLFKHLNQPNFYKEFVDLAKSFKIEEQESWFKNKEVFENFLQYWKYGFLPKGEIFAISYFEHREQAIALFKLFYYAKDYETFFKTAVWAREYLNEGLFLYSFSVAVVHRPETRQIILPPIYEIYPYYFFNTEVIQKAYKYKQMHGGEKVSEHGYDGYTIDANYSGFYLNLHPEQSLSYYLEDVGVNSFYYYFNIYYPFWMSGKEFGFSHINRGEQFYFIYQQILARFYLERLSNDFGEIPYFNWDLPIETSYYPSLEYPNGLEFPARPKFANLHEYFYNYGQSWSSKGPYGYSYSFVKDYERRINDVIDRGYVWSHEGKKIELWSQEGLNVLGNIIQSNPDSPNSKFYGPLQTFARHLLGYSYQALGKYKVVPSALEHFETSMRDPVFYQLYKRIINKFQRLLAYLPYYSKEDLVFPGVKVTDIHFDNLITYFDYFYSDLSNAVFDNKQELEHDTFHVRARQYRLNNKGFTYKFTVKSDKETKSVVKVFLGPKYDEYGRFINISENRINFVLVDYFVYDLKSGENVISRNSYDSHIYAPDTTSYYELYKQVLGAYEGQQPFHYGKQNYFRFPQRFILPKGTEGGLPYQFFIIVYPYASKQVEQHPQYAHYFYPYEGEQQFYDSYSLGYPFDRHIKYEKLWESVPNFAFYESKIFHKDVKQINAV